MTQTVTQPVAVQADYQRIPGNKAVATVQGGQPAGGSSQGGEGTWGFIVGNIDNQADLMERLNAKVDTTTYQAAVPPHLSNFLNPHQVTKAQVGLDQVDNTSDANKPMSNPTKTYIDGQVAAVDSTRVAKAGDTMTGTLAVTFADTNTAGITVNTPNATLIMNKGVGVTQALVDGRRNNLMRWRVALGDATAESGLNAGSDYALNRYDDAGALIGTAYKVIRGTGQLQVIQNTATPALRVQALSTGNATIDLQKGAASSSNSIRGGTASMTTGLRWQMNLGEGTAESGGNVGSNFTIGRYSDTGAFLANALSISRVNGEAIFTGDVITDKSAAGIWRGVYGSKNNLRRWGISLAGNQEAESGANAGSNFVIDRYDDAGNWVNVALKINRSDGYAQFEQGLLCGWGYRGRQGMGGAISTSVHNWYWTGSLQAWVDTTNVGNVTLTSDERVKQAVVAMPDYHTAFMAIQPKQYRWGDVGIFKDDGREYAGWSAQQLIECGFGHAVDGSVTALQENGDPQPASVQDRPILAQAVKEVQTLWARVADLESKLAAALDRITQLEGA